LSGATMAAAPSISSFQTGESQVYRRLPVLLSAWLVVFALTAQSRAAEPNKRFCAAFPA